MLISRTTDAKSTTVHTYVPSCVVTGIKIVHSPFSNEESVFPLPSDRRRWVLRHTTSATTGDRVRKCSYLYTSWEHASSAFPVQTKTGLCAIVNASTCDDLPQSPRYCVSTMFVATTTCLRFLRSSGHKRPRDVCKKIKNCFPMIAHTYYLSRPTYLSSLSSDSPSFRPIWSRRRSRAQCGHDRDLWQLSIAPTFEYAYGCTITIIIIPCVFGYDKNRW